LKKRRPGLRRNWPKKRLRRPRPRKRQAFYEQLHAQAYATGDVASQLTQSPSYFGLTEAELKEIMAESAEESLDENYRQIMSFVEAG
jgi:hypothetical protein